MESSGASAQSTMNGAINCKESGLFEDYFQKDSAHQIFYNKGTRCMVFRLKKTLFSISIDSQNISKMEIPFEGPIYDLQLHKKERYVAYTIAHNILSINHLRGKLGKEQLVKMPKLDKPESSILHFEWVYGCESQVDFIACRPSGVSLFKLDADKRALKEVKQISLDISACWFDPFNEILCCASVHQDGRIHAFYFDEKRPQFRYKGAEFRVESTRNEFSEPAAQKRENSATSQMLGFLSKQLNKLQQKLEPVNFVTTGDSRNKDLVLLPRDPDVLHQIALIVLYSITYLVHMNPFRNKVTLYQLKYDSVEPSELNITAPSENGIRFSVADNLLVIHSIPENLSLFYDIRSKTSSFQIGPPQSLEVMRESSSTPSRNQSIILDTMPVQNNLKDVDDEEQEQQQQQQHITAEELIAREGFDEQSTESQRSSQQQQTEVDITQAYRNTFTVNRTSKRIPSAAAAVAAQQSYPNNNNNNIRASQTVSLLPDDDEPIETQQQAMQDVMLNLLDLDEKSSTDLSKKLNWRGLFSAGIQITDNPVYLSQSSTNSQINLLGNDNDELTIPTTALHSSGQFDVTDGDSEHVNRQSKQFSSNLVYCEDKYVFPGDEFIINPKDRKFYTMKVNISQIQKLAIDEVDGFNVIIRRANSKEYGLNHMRKVFLKKQHIRYFMLIFNQILSHYKKRGIPKPKGLDDGKKDFSAEVISPLDVQNLFFFSLYNNPYACKVQLSEVLAEYIAAESECTQFKQRFQLGLDMLFRLRKYYVIFNILIAKGLFQQALDLARKHSLNKLKLKEIVWTFLQKKGDMDISSILEFFRETTSKTKNGEKYGFSYFDFVNELTSQQQKQAFSLQQLQEPSIF